MITLGLDIGTNSVGSAWVDTDQEEISLGVSVFPAGVDEADDQRGAPKNQARRGKRSLRRTLARRSQRKRNTRRTLTQYGLLPSDPEQLKDLFAQDPGPWALRRHGLDEPLTAYQFGRALVHLGQRRGAVGFDSDADDEGKVKKAMTRVQLAMLERYSSDETRQTAQDLRDRIESLGKKQKRKDEERKAYDEACENLKQLCESVMRSNRITFGRFMADLLDKRRHDLSDDQGNPKRSKKGNRSHYYNPIRNRLDSFEFHANRAMIRDEFERLWKRQSEPDGALAHLPDERLEQLKQELDHPERDGTWRHKGHLFGQRNTYWDTGTLGRCDLEPTDRCVPIADRHASYYRVLESVNNIRVRGPYDEQERPLCPDERQKVIDRLRSQKTGTVAAVRAALGIDKRSLKKQDISEKSWSLNLERDEDREINTDWFHREIVLGAIGEETWNKWPETKQEGLNRAILKCDPAIDDDKARLCDIAKRIDLDEDTSQRLVMAWQTRPKLEKRLNLSRRAILNLLPYMEQQLPDNRWPTQIEARQMYAEDGENGAMEDRRRRYRLGAKPLNKADRHYRKKHLNELPPAPTLSNPVVRKAIHEVRRHVIEHIRAHDGAKPDRVVIEFAREAQKSAKLNDRILKLNRRRDKIRKNIIEDIVKPTFGTSFHKLSHNQLKSAVDRVILARQQKGRCPYCGKNNITDFVAARGEGFEIDHIIPYSRCGINSWGNRVLCHYKCNRDKRQQTPKEWWRDEFDNHISPMNFMDGYEPSKDDLNEYFTKPDYAAKWKNFNREDVPKQWRGSQLTDTAYAVRQVQAYLQNALWPDEPSHLEGGHRRIFVTKGAYTHLLRKDWQLFAKTIDPFQNSVEEVQQVSAKNRGDHREHAIDAVAIALTDSDRIKDLARLQQAVEEARAKGKEEGQEGWPRRKSLDPPWSSTVVFRAQVMRMAYSEYDRLHGESLEDGKGLPIVVCHRPIGRRIIGAFHEDTLFGPVPDMPDTYMGRKSIVELTPNHLRLPEPEKKKDSIERLTKEFLENNKKTTKREAEKRAKALVESPEFKPPDVDPSPGKSGLIRDLALRKQIRECIASYEYTEKDRDGNIKIRRRLDPNHFIAKEIKQASEAGAIHHKSGVPIKRVRLLRTMTNPVILHRKKWDHPQQQWVRDTGKDTNLQPGQRSRADRAYVGGNNHHIEIRENNKGKWKGVVVSMFDAAQRVRNDKRNAVDREDAPEKGGRFIMSLAEGETVYMKHPDTGEPDYFVVFKIDKPQTIHFKHHWDARRDKGEKDENGNVIPDSKREDVGGNGIVVSKLRDLAPPNHDTPIKVRVSPLGVPTRLNHD